MGVERLRQAIIGGVGLVFVSLVYFLASDLWRARWLVQMKGNECEPMFLSFFVGLGAFLLLAARRPSQHRSLIAFAACSSLLHAAVMAIETVQAWNRGVHRDYADVLVFAVIGLVLIAVTPGWTRARATPGQEAAAALVR